MVIENKLVQNIGRKVYTHVGPNIQRKMALRTPDLVPPVLGDYVVETAPSKTVRDLIKMGRKINKAVEEQGEIRAKEVSEEEMIEVLEEALSLD